MKDHPGPLAAHPWQAGQPASPALEGVPPPPPPLPPPPDGPPSSGAEQSWWEHQGFEQADPPPLPPEPEQAPLPAEEATVPSLPPHLLPSPTAALLLPPEGAAAAASPARRFDCSLPALPPLAVPEQASVSPDLPAQVGHLPPHLQVTAPAVHSSPVTAAVEASPEALPPLQVAAPWEAASTEHAKAEGPQSSSSQQVFEAPPAEVRVPGANPAEAPSDGTRLAQPTRHEGKLAGVPGDGAKAMTEDSSLAKAVDDLSNNRRDCGDTTARGVLLNGRKTERSAEPLAQGGDRMRRVRDERWRRRSRSRSCSRSRRMRSRVRSRSRSRSRSRRRSRSRSRSRSRTPLRKGRTGEGVRQDRLLRGAEQRSRGPAAGDQQRDGVRQGRHGGVSEVTRPDRRTVVEYVERQTEMRRGNIQQHRKGSRSPGAGAPWREGTPQVPLPRTRRQVQPCPLACWWQGTPRVPTALTQHVSPALPRARRQARHRPLACW